MIREIKAQKPEQLILVTSAHSEADKLLQLIDIGVDKFVLKPLDLTKLLDALVNLAFILEHNNEMSTCQARIKELETELSRLKGQSPESTKAPLPKQDANPLDHPLLELYEKKLHNIIYDIQMEADFTDTHKEALLHTLDTYAKALPKEAEFEELVLTLNKLDQSIEYGEELFSQKIVETTQMLESVVSNLQTWRVSQSAEDKNLLLRSMKRIMAFLRA